MKDYILKKKEMDRVANNFKRRHTIPHYDYIMMYLLVLRKCEFWQARGGGTALSKIMSVYYKFRLRQLSIKTGITIHPNTFDGGLTIYHWGSIVVNSNVKAGKFVTLQNDVNISKDVVIGNNVYIAPGAKILEGVHIADGVMIGANSVVTKSILEPYTTWVGAPAYKIKNTGCPDKLGIYYKDIES